MQDTTASPPWAKIPPLIIRLPEQSRRQPRASKAQSGDIVWDKPRQRAVGGPGGQHAPRFSRGLTCEPWALGAPRPRPRRPIRGLSRAICIRPAPGPRAHPRCVPQETHQPAQKPLTKCLLRVETWVVLSPRLQVRHWGQATPL